MSEEKNYGARIRLLRESLKMNQGEFAKLAGVTVRAQRNYESGISNPSVGYLESLATHGIDVVFIITGEQGFTWRTMASRYMSAYHWLSEKVGLSETTADKLARFFPVDTSDDERLRTIDQIGADNSIGNINPVLLGKIIEAIEEMSPALPTRKKAGIASLLYRSFRATGHVDMNAVKEAVGLAL